MRHATPKLPMPSCAGDELAQRARFGLHFVEAVLHDIADADDAGARTPKRVSRKRICEV
jgi:hypothetical protein